MVFPQKNKKAPRQTSPYKIIVSACLSGINCTYNGKNKLNKKIKAMVDRGLALPVCPEILGGSRVPRPPCEIIAGDGDDVLDKKARVITHTGLDITSILIKGAKQTLKITDENRIKDAILKSNSPSCGCGYIYDGSFHGTLKKGVGVTTALLKRHGVKIFNEKDEGSWPARFTSRK